MREAWIFIKKEQFPMHEKFPLSELQDFVAQTLDLWHVPGVSVAVVKDGQVILSQGFGLRNLAQQLPVTAGTIFPIASCTKAFTAMCLALLVDEGKLEWDQPVRKYLPNFKLVDPHATELMTPRDLLCHRSGLPRHDLMWYGASFNRQEIFRRLQFAEPNRSFRSSFQYQNMMYMVAGVLIHRLSGMTWEAFVRSRIFEPLGMARSNTSTAVTQADPDHSRPYLYRKETLEEIPYYETNDDSEATGPAGTINSCSADMAQWLLVHTQGGKAGESSFVSPHNLDEMHKPQIFIDDPQVRLRLGFDFLSYGLGWFMRSYKGHMLLSHGGNIDGFSSLASFLPRHNLGVVVLSNGEGVHNNIPSVISWTIYDRLLGLEASDWNAVAKKLVDEMLQAGEQSKQLTSLQRRQAPPSHPLEEYLGDYEHPGYGVYSVRPNQAGLELVMNDKISLKLEHYHYDIFEAELARFDIRLKLAFSTDTKGNLAGFATQVEELAKEIFFARLPDQRLSDPAFLAQFTGEYELLGIPMTIALVEGKLIARLPGEEHELSPYYGMEFVLKGQTGYSITFQQEADGSVPQALVTQPGVVFTAVRKSGQPAGE
jgi:CubicO group peptidase (beta-lactamase class C family)